jgi:hypothetical protein
MEKSFVGVGISTCVDFASTIFDILTHWRKFRCNHDAEVFIGCMAVQPIQNVYLLAFCLLHVRFPFAL